MAAQGSPGNSWAEENENVALKNVTGHQTGRYLTDKSHSQVCFMAHLMVKKSKHGKWYSASE